MKRSELYLRAWQTPLSRLGPELGLSDVGLSKLCKRYGIPVPPRGYWAKMEAGVSVKRKPLPPRDDLDVPLPDQRSVARQRAKDGVRAELRDIADAARKSTPLPSGLGVRETLAGCLPIVSRTAKAFEGLRREIAAKKKARESAIPGRPNFEAMFVRQTNCGRYWTPGEGGLSITATLTNIDWILRFHDALIRGFISAGCKVESNQERGLRRVEVSHTGESIQLNFSEGYEKIDLPKSRTSLWARTEYRPLETFRVKMERPFGSGKQWRGTKEQLEAMLPEIVRHFVMTLKAQAGQREVLEAEEDRRRERQARYEEERRIWFAAQKRIGEQRAARRAQVDRAQQVAVALASTRALTELLAHVESSGEGDEGVSAWLKVVRAGLQDPVEELVSAIRVEWSGAAPPLWSPLLEGAEHLSPEPRDAFWPK